MGNLAFINQPNSKYKVTNTQPHQKFCLDLAINDQNNLFGLGSNKNVKVQQFKNGQTKQLQVLVKHNRNIATLTFFKKKPFLISSSWDSSIILWPCNLMANPKYAYQLKGHLNDIRCVIVHHQLEDLIISSSDDKTIKFWQFYQQSWSCVQTIKEHTDFIFQLSLNPDGNKLISCSCDNQIIIMEGSNKSQWQVVQKIQLNYYGYRLCFITNDMFAFQPYKGTHLLIYKLNSSQKFLLKVVINFVGTYSLSSIIILNHTIIFFVNLFEKNYYSILYLNRQYIPSNNNLVVKNGCYVNVIRFTQIDNINDEVGTDLKKYQYELKEVIKLQNNIAFGIVSENGEYLIIYDKIQQLIEIRRKSQQQ